MNSIKSEFEKTKKLLEERKDENEAVKFIRYLFGAMAAFVVLVILGSAIVNVLIPAMAGAVNSTM